MNVLQVSYSDTTGGAARAAWRQNEGLRSIGVDSRMVVRERRGDAERALLISAVENPVDLNSRVVLYDAQNYGIVRNRTTLSNTLFSLGAPGMDLSGLQEFVNADVVNLHWISFFLSPFTISRLADLGPALVWTLHDQWAFTGGCHYAAGCTGYLASCSPCPQLTPLSSPLAVVMLEEKRRTYGRKPLVIVTPSRWMADCAKASRLLSQHRVEVIPYGLDLHALRPHDKLMARHALGLPEDGFLLLFGADHGNEERKGFHVAAEALRLAMNELGARGVNPDWHLVSFGRPASTIDQLGVPAHGLGYVDDDERLRLAYCAADVFVLPSLEDNLPNTMLEAMACGTPVLASNAGGMAETVRHGQNGLLAATGSADAFAAAMITASDNREWLAGLGRNARARMEAEYTLELSAGRYLDLYRELAPSRATVPIPSRVETTAAEVAGSPELVGDERLLRVVGGQTVGRRWLFVLREVVRLVKRGQFKQLAAHARRRMSSRP